MGGNSKGHKRRFGSIRKLPSGRFQARYPGPDGAFRPAPDTFRTHTEAAQYLVEVEADMMRQEWIDPDAGKITVHEYATRWIAERSLEDRTIELYEGLLRNHICPHLGTLMLADLTAAHIRTWRTDLLTSGTGHTTVAKAYRFLRAVLNTAVDDEIVRRNPCRIKGAGQETAPERPVITLTEVFAIAAHIQPRYCALVLIAAFGQLRFGELVALRRDNLILLPARTPNDQEIAAGIDPAELIDDGIPVLKVERSVSQLNSGKQRTKKPKSAAGVRTVALPAGILPELRHHLEVFAEPGPKGRLFVGPKGATPKRGNFHRLWKKALAGAEVHPALHLHDLRHTGGTMTARTGATLKEIMARLGQSSARAAMIYQHATSERDREIAAALDLMIAEARAAVEGAAEQSRDRGDDEGLTLPPVA
ncbi:MAG: site-specific integrase [Actinomycetota bacterium]|nr:site-specific integrase [Actinomycetota bacterium]